MIYLATDSVSLLGFGYWEIWCLKSVYLYGAVFTNAACNKSSVNNLLINTKIWFGVCSYMMLVITSSLAVLNRPNIFRSTVIVQFQPQIFQCMGVLRFFQMWTTNLRAGLNRGVLMGRLTQIMGGSFRRGLNSEVVPFLLKSLFSPRPCTKIKKQDGSLLFLNPAF